MTYKEIIEKNVKRYSIDWPRYAFHMAGVNNAIKILSEGYIYSRNKAIELGKMSQDNASQGVIDNTDNRVKAFARFYFRPKTPTYYHFEGYHQEGLRYQNDNHVNMTLPVLFLFDLETLLLDPGTVFNGIKASGNNYNPQQGVDAFNSLQFDKIYHDGSTKDSTIMDCRHAEVLYPDQYPIKNALKRIICRNTIEAVTFKTLLRETSTEIYEMWKPIIESDPSYFNLSGLRLEATSVQNDKETLVMKFKLIGHNAYYRYIQNKNIINYTPLSDYPPLDFIFDVQFNGHPYHHTFTAHINLNVKDEFSGTDNIPHGAERIRIKAYFNEEESIVFIGRMPIPKGVKRFKLVLDCNEIMNAFPEKSVIQNPQSFSTGYDEFPF